MVCVSQTIFYSHKPDLIAKMRHDDTVRYYYLAEADLFIRFLND